MNCVLSVRRCSCVNLTPGKPRLVHLDPTDGIYWTREVVPIQNDEIGKLAHFNRADLVLKEHEIGIVDRIETQGLHPIEGLFWMELAFVAASPSRDGDPHAEERMVWIN